jgi:hypothetical protein
MVQVGLDDEIKRSSMEIEIERKRRRKRKERGER